VFVFAFTQVTALPTNPPTWGGLGQALLIMTALWWAWASYAWLTNTIDAEVGIGLAAVLAAAGAMFIAAPAVPAALGRPGRRARRGRSDVHCGTGGPRGVRKRGRRLRRGVPDRECDAGGAVRARRPRRARPTRR